MREKSFREAINEALRQEMELDERVVLIGEDIAGGNGGIDGAAGSSGGMLGVTKGLYNEFGPARVIDTPISESAIMGAAAGSALTGLRPVAELMFMDFFGVCFDQIYNQAAKFRYMFGGTTERRWLSAVWSVPVLALRLSILRHFGLFFLIYQD